MANQTILILAAIAAAYVYFRWIFKPRKVQPSGGRKARLPKRLDPATNIVVDGSNVMHWDGEPSALILNRVLVALDEKGLNPFVFFDANVGYKLWDRHANARHVAPKIGVAVDRVVVAPSGVTADELLLEFAVKHGLRVVSNDRFLDWRVKYPKAGMKGFSVKGEWRQGSVMLRGL